MPVTGERIHCAAVASLSMPGSSGLAKVLVAAAAALLVRTLILLAIDVVHAGPYVATRDAAAFASLPMGQVSNALDDVLRPDTPVAPGATIEDAPGDLRTDLKYFLSEGLAPRRVLASADHVIEIVEAPPAGSTLLAQWPPGHFLVLVGAPQSNAGSRGDRTTRLDIVGIGVAILALYGVGWVVTTLLRAGAAHDVLEAAAIAIVTGALGVALLAHLSTWFQAGVTRELPVAAGLIGAIAAIAAGRGQRPNTSVEHAHGADRWLMALVSAAIVLALLRAATVPVTGWDGRFVWLFHGAQVFFDGYLPRSYAPPELQPTYPLFTPAVFAWSAGWQPEFNERSAAVLGVVVHGAVLVLLARLAQRRLGTAAGFVITSFVFSSTIGLSAEAYADGLLATLLAVQFLALHDDRAARLGWILAAAAALTKREGLVLAGIVALAGRRFGPGLVVALAPAFVHGQWAALAGFTHGYERWHQVDRLGEWGERLGLISWKAAATLRRSPALLLSASAFALLAGQPGLNRDRFAWCAWQAACVMLLFLLATFLLTPFPLGWHLDTSLSRIALHPAQFAILALAAGTAARDGDRRI